jgi:hypothetical protein
MARGNFTTGAQRRNARYDRIWESAKARDSNWDTLHGNTVHNPECGGSHCTEATGEVRVLPLGGGANLILCRPCFNHENAYRRQRGRETGNPEGWPVVDWDTAKPYPEPEE